MENWYASSNDDEQPVRHPVHRIRTVRNGFLCQLAGFRRQYSGRLPHTGAAGLPIVIRTTEEAFKDLPDSFREGSLALGATKAQTIWNVLLPMAMPRIITGLILSLGRVSGETAPILFTCAAYFLPKLPDSIFDQCMALPYHLYVVATSGTDIEAQMPIAYGTAFVLILIVLLMNLAANSIRKFFENKLKQK